MIETLIYSVLMIVCGVLVGFTWDHFFEHRADKEFLIESIKSDVLSINLKVDKLMQKNDQ